MLILKTIATMKRHATLLILMMMIQGIYAQEAVNMKFGKPTKEELGMTVYAPDSSADAVVLCRLTDVSYTIQPQGYLVDYKEKIRIKVLKPEGNRHANVEIFYYQDPNEEFSTETIKDLKATAYNQEGTKTVKTVMGKELIFTEKLDDTRYRLKFTIPQVRQGTVIEYEYTRHSDIFYLLEDWFPQTDIPVVFARLTMEIPALLIFNIEEHGIQRLTCSVTQGSLSYNFSNASWAKGYSSVKTNKYVCIGNNLKAMRKDDYVWNVNDYRAGITAALHSFAMPTSSQYHEYTKTWEQIDDLILDDEDLGKRLNHHSPLRDELEAAKITAIADEEERAATVYKMVMARVSWDGDYKMWPRQSSNSTLKKGGGSNADINLLLIQSFRDAGLNAAPVVLRARNYGLLPFSFPTIQKLSTYVVGIILQSGRIIYVDASSTYGYINMLPAALQVEKARLIMKGGKSQWVNLQKVTQTQTITIIEATLAEDGTLRGTQTTRYTGNDAARHRMSLMEAGDSTTYKNQLDEKYGMHIESCRQEDGNTFAPAAVETITFSKQGEVSNGRIYISPFCMPPMEENPFTAKERLMAVEFPYRQYEQINVNIILPNGWVMEDGPKQTSASITDKSVSGRLLTSTGDGKVQVQYQFNINSMTIPSSSYPALRQMFELFTEHSKDMLVIKRKE